MTAETHNQWHRWDFRPPVTWACRDCPVSVDTDTILADERPVEGTDLMDRWARRLDRAVVR